MRIGIDIHTIGARQTGNETYITNLVDNLLQTATPETEYFLYRTRNGQPPDWPGQHRKVWPHLSAIRIPLSFPYLLNRDRIDVAHFQYVMPPVCPCPAVVMVHDISYEFFPEFFNPLSRKRMQTLIPLSARRSAHVLTVSEFSKRQIVETYGLPDDRITVTYNGVSDRFTQTPDDESRRQSLAALGVNSPYLLAVGNLQPRKNIERLIRVFAKLRQAEKISQKLVVVGQKHWKGHDIFDSVKDSGVEDEVILTGYVSNEDLVQLYNGADVFIYPSFYEGFGLPVIESMACGTPVITSNVASIPEVAGDAGLLIDPASDLELENAIVSLADNPSKRQSMIQQGLAQANRFKWSTTAEQTFNILHRVAT